jgi:cephalosporin-C deacetylase
MLVYVGLADDVCPPETGYALYNTMTCPKEIHAYPRCAHDSGVYWEMPKVEAFLAAQLKPAAYMRHAEPTVG